MILTCILSRTVLPLSRGVGQVIAFNKECLSSSHSFRVFNCEYRHESYIAEKNIFSGLHFCCRQCVFSFNQLTQLALRCDAFGVITHNNACFSVPRAYASACIRCQAQRQDQRPFPTSSKPGPRE